eukprot:3341924-Alexandrium_andersonii.AAC.1
MRQPTNLATEGVWEIPRLQAQHADAEADAPLDGLLEVRVILLLGVLEYLGEHEGKYDDLAVLDGALGALADQVLEQCHHLGIEAGLVEHGAEVVEGRVVSRDLLDELDEGGNLSLQRLLCFRGRWVDHAIDR